jgi:hypothetical protein
MSPPAFSGRIARTARFASHVAPLVRGADGAARRPYRQLNQRHRFSEP